MLTPTELIVSSQDEVESPTTEFGSPPPVPVDPDERYITVANADNSGYVGLGLEFSESIPGDISLRIRSIHPEGFISKWNRQRQMVNFLERRRRTAVPVLVDVEGDHVVQITDGRGVSTQMETPAEELMRVLSSHSRMDLKIARLSLRLRRGLQLQPPPKRARQLKQFPSDATGPSTMSMSVSWPDDQEDEVEQQQQEQQQEQQQHNPFTFP